MTARCRLPSNNRMIPKIKSNMTPIFFSSRPGRKDPVFLFFLLSVLVSLCVSGGIFLVRHAGPARTPGALLGMSRDEYQAYQLEYQHLLFENEQLVRQLRDMEQAAARQGVWIDKIREENFHLRDKISLMDRLARLQQSVSELKEKQAPDAESVDVLRAEEPGVAISRDTLEEARAALERAKVRIRMVEERMGTLIPDVPTGRIAVPADSFPDRSRLGNKGYLFRQGGPFPVDGAL